MYGKYYERFDVGMVVGASGTGKTTALKHLLANLGSDVIEAEGFEWKAQLSVVSQLAPGRRGSAEAEAEAEALRWLLESFHTAQPMLLKPYDALSNSEQQEANLLRALAEASSAVMMRTFSSWADVAVLWMLPKRLNRAHWPTKENDKKC